MQLAIEMAKLSVGLRLRMEKNIHMDIEEDREEPNRRITVDPAAMKSEKPIGNLSDYLLRSR